MYYVNSTNETTDKDEIYSDLQQAVDRAVEMSDGDGGFVFGVWSDGGETCLMLIYGGEIFRK